MQAFTSYTIQSEKRHKTHLKRNTNGDKHSHFLRKNNYKNKAY